MWGELKTSILHWWAHLIGLRKDNSSLKKKINKSKTNRPTKKMKIHTLAPSRLLLLATAELLPNGWSYFPLGAWSQAFHTEKMGTGPANPSFPGEELNPSPVQALLKTACKILRHSFGHQANRYQVPSLSEGRCRTPRGSKCLINITLAGWPSCVWMPLLPLWHSPKRSQFK